MTQQSTKNGHPSSFVCICVDKYYIQPADRILAQNAPIDAFNTYVDGTQSEDTTVYMLCTARVPNIISATPDKAGTSLHVTAGFQGVPDFRCSFVVPMKKLGIHSGCAKSLANVPFREDWLHLRLNNGNGYYVSAWWFCKRFGPPEFQDASVFYVGKGDGQNYKNGSIDRILNGHSAYQRLKTLISREHVVLILAARLKVVSFFIDPVKGLAFEKLKLADEKWKTEVFEAASIFTFKPLLNVQHKFSFPAPSIREAAYFKGLDIVYGEINTEDLNINLYSDFVPPRGHHIIQPIAFSPKIVVEDFVRQTRTQLPGRILTFRQL